MELTAIIPFSTPITVPAVALGKLTAKTPVADVTPVSFVEVGDVQVVVCWGCHPGGVFDHRQFLSQDWFKGVFRWKDEKDLTTNLEGHFKRVHATAGRDPCARHLVFVANHHAAAWRDAAKRVIEEGLNDMGIDSVNKDAVEEFNKRLNDIARYRRGLMPLDE